MLLIWILFVCRWAGGKDDKYFARIGKNVVSVYETETFSLIDKKSIKVENVMDFCWSPTDPILALFVPELGNQPAKASPLVFLVSRACCFGRIGVHMKENRQFYEG